MIVHLIARFYGNKSWYPLSEIGDLAYFGKNWIITPAESAFVAHHNDTCIISIGLTIPNLHVTKCISIEVYFDLT